MDGILMFFFKFAYNAFVKLNQVLLQVQAEKNDVHLLLVKN